MNYGAFDRMKILADIAPFSPEYRMWRDIAKKTITDPDLKEQMDEIRERVNQQGKKHDFYQYQVVGRGLKYQNVVVSEVLGYGRFRSGNTIYKIAGATVKGNAEETMQDVLGRYIHPGQKITVAADENTAYHTNDDSVRSIDVAVFAGGENVGQEMIQNGDAVKRKGDTSAAAVLANLGPIQRAVGYASEVIAHLDVPWLSDQFLRVRTPLESYEAEQVYGTPYQTWSHPIDSFLMPAFERAIHDRTPFLGLIGTAARYAESVEGLAPGLKKAIDATWFLSDRGAFMGAALSNLTKPAGTSGAGEQMKRWGRHGSAIVQAAHFMTGGNSMLDETLSGANIGEEVARVFKKNRIAGGVIGAAVGVANRILFGDDGDWVPDRTKKKWEMEDYFDRLTYLKYHGLYEKAARKAKKEEGVDIEDVLDKLHEREASNKQAISYFKKLKKQLYLSQPLESKDMKDAVSDLNRRIEELSNDKEVIPGGKWTRTALIYKQASDSTMYGLSKDSSWAQIITALPSNDREYFMEFVKEKDQDKRKEILDHVSPFLRRALNLAWGGGKNVPKQKSNKKFFKKHELPKKNWAGWAPQFSLDDIEVKTIANEGMMLADFGYYDSQLRDPNVKNAPTVNYHNTSTIHNMAAVRRNLQKVLEGRGLKDVDIDIMPGPSGGASSIKASIKHMMGMKDVQDKINNNLSMKAGS